MCLGTNFLLKQLEVEKGLLFSIVKMNVINRIFMTLRYVYSPMIRILRCLLLIKLRKVQDFM